MAKFEPLLTTSVGMEASKYIYRPGLESDVLYAFPNETLTGQRPEMEASVQHDSFLPNDIAL